MNNPVLSNLISSFTNAQNANLDNFEISRSHLLVEVLDLLTLNGYIVGYSNKNNNKLRVHLKYPNMGKLKLSLVSKPSKRVYGSLPQLLRFLHKNELYIISSSYGLITNKEASLLRIGGEILIKINK